MPDISMTFGQIPVDQRMGYWCWSDSRGLTEVRFVGRGAKASRREILGAANGSEARLELCQLEQIHSSSVVQAVPGQAARGDALITSRSLLALSIATADCVPVLLASGLQTAAVHAGWRGIAAGIVPKAARLIGSHGKDTTAWIGPSIGPCCYEVGPEVASRVLGEHYLRNDLNPSTNRSHLDLGMVVIEQLRAAGIRDIRHISMCTKCNPERLWSYRGQAQKTGRHNLAFIWRDS